MVDRTELDVSDLTQVEREIFGEFMPFFRAMVRGMADNQEEKGESWKMMSWSDLMDGVCKQLEDMQADPDREDFYANIGNYAAMLWLNEEEGMYGED